MTAELTEAYPAIEQAANFWDGLALVNLISDSLFYISFCILIVYISFFAKHDFQEAKKAVIAKANVASSAGFFKDRNVPSMRSNADT
jgi:hypothetical protein